MNAPRKVVKDLKVVNSPILPDDRPFKEGPHLHQLRPQLRLVRLELAAMAIPKSIIFGKLVNVNRFSYKGQRVL
jgi:hypothetical protein